MIQLDLDHQTRVHVNGEPFLDILTHPLNPARTKRVDLNGAVSRSSIYAKLVATFVILQVALYGWSAGVPWKVLNAFTEGPVVVSADLVQVVARARSLDLALRLVFRHLYSKASISHVVHARVLRAHKLGRWLPGYSILRQLLLLRTSNKPLFVASDAHKLAFNAVKD
jgi:hypothetical protein